MPDPVRGTAGGADRRAFIIRHGVLRYGLVLGLLVFGWIAVGDYVTVFDRLSTQADWVRLLVLLALCLAVWTVGAGWLIGAALWFVRDHMLPPARSPRRRRE